MKRIIVLVIVVSVCILIQSFDGLPWWTFVIPVFLLGIFLPLKRWRITTFFWGFNAGFLVWTVSTFYFQQNYGGAVIGKIADIVDLHLLLLYALIGTIGGVLTGLALSAGFLLRRGRETLGLALD